MREGLCHDISLKPYMGNRKVAIVDDADYLNAEGANSLLKTLEEPPPRSVLILVGTTPAKQLPTIRSRCRIIRFDPLPTETVAELADPRRACRAIPATHSGWPNWPTAASAVPCRWPTAGSSSFAHAVCRVESPRPGERAGWPAPSSRSSRTPDRKPRDDGRDSTRCSIRPSTSIATCCGISAAAVPPEDPELVQYVNEAAGSIPGGTEAIGACIDHCLETGELIDRNRPRDQPGRILGRSAGRNLPDGADPGEVTVAVRG